MKTYNYHKRLDDVLKSIILKQSREFPEGINTMEDLDDDNDAIIEKLERDKMVFKNTEGKYIGTFEGKLFIEEGGYSQMLKDKVLQREHLKNSDTVAKRNALALSIGAIGLLIWEVCKFLLEHLSCHC